MEDIIKFLVDQFDFRRPSRALRDFVASSIVVDFGDRFLEKIQPLTGILEALRKCLDSSADDIVAQSLRYSGTIEIAAGARLAVHYVLEERSNKPPGTNWLFSQAPLNTNEHEALLHTIHAIVTGSGGM